MENNRNDDNQHKMDKSKSNQGPKHADDAKNPNPAHKADHTENRQQHQTQSNVGRKDSMDNTPGSDSTGQQTGSDSMNPRTQTQEHLQDQKQNKGNVTNKDSEPSVSRDAKKQNNTGAKETSTSDTSNPYTNKQHNSNVDDESVLVEDEDEASVISDDIEGAPDQTTPRR